MAAQYISDLITNEDIKSWNKNKSEIITIKAGTGMGKSHFIKTRLYLHAKTNNQRILMLVHRLNCLDQFQYEMQRGGRTDVITIATYQSIEARVKKGEEFNFESYDYIVSDEFHYFMSDAAFNIYTDLSLKKILKQSNKVRIFMSATGDYMEKYFKEVRRIEPIKRNIPINYDFIRSLKFFYKESVFDDLIEEFINEGKKAIFFIHSAKDAYQLYRKFKDYTMFNCSKHNNDYYKYVDKEKVDRMLRNEKFDSLILITTTVLDAGVNIIDKELNNIVVDVKDTGSLIQSIGRKRLQGNDDYINLYIKAKTNEQLGGRKKHMQERLEKANYVKEHGTQAYVDKYFRNTNDYSNIIYDNPVSGGVEKEINDMIYFKTRADLSEVNKMLEKDYGYCKYIAWKLGRYDPHAKKYNYRVIEEDQEKMSIEKYLDSIKGKKLFKEEQEILKEVFKRNGLHARTLGINTLNGNLKDRKMTFKIVPKRSSKRVNGISKSYRYWEVISDVDV